MDALRTDGQDRPRSAQSGTLPQATGDQPGTVHLLLPLAAIILDSQFQPRGWTTQHYQLDADHVERLAASNPEMWPPLLVMPADQSGTFYLLDGWHRFCVARDRLGLPALRCQVIPHGDITDAVRANLTHGLPLSMVDRKAYAIWLYSAYPHDEKPSYRAIAREAGLSPNTVQAAIEAADQNEQQPIDDASERSDTGSASPNNGLQHVSRLLARAARSWGGVNPLWGGSAEQQRASHIMELLECARSDQRGQLLRECQEWGAALIGGVRLYQNSAARIDDTTQS